MSPRGAALALLAAALLVAARPARASTEEFSTFSVLAQEEDDESLLDHFQARFPYEWRSEWEHARQAIRTSNGCLTSGQWFINTDLKTVAPLGEHSTLGVTLKQFENDIALYDQLDFTFHFRLPVGTAGLLVRPYHDKSRQDFGLRWDVGADTSAWQLQAVFTFEDLFNNLWAFRQTRVGNEAEPYERHPWEPALRMVSRHEHWRLELSGKWLTPSRKRLGPLVGTTSDRLETLWGARGAAALEVRALGVEWNAGFGNLQARSTDGPTDLSAPPSFDYRRSWSGEVGARRALGPRVMAQAHVVYQRRDESYGPGAGTGFLASLDRLYNLELEWHATPRVAARFGGLFDRVGVARSGAQRVFSYGTRNESRAYLGLILRFGRVTLMGIEGIELDPEPYDVWFYHDKGFLQMQTTF